MPTDTADRPEAEVISDLLLARLAAVAARARRFGMGVTVGQVVALVDALGACPVETLPELKRLVRLMLATRTAELPLLDAIVDKVFGPAFTPDSDPPGAPPPMVTTDEIRNRLLRALEHGDLGGATESGVLAAELGRPEWVGGAGRAGQRILRALDLSELLSRALSTGKTIPDLERRVALAEGEASLRAFEDALLSELRRREDRAGLDGWETSAQEHEALLGITDELPLAGRTASEQEQLRATLRPLARRLAARARRRRRGGHDNLDVRRTLARSVGTGGVPMALHFRRHRPRTALLVVLADVSGSMVDYSNFTLSLLEALRHELRDLRCFVFVDGAAEVTGETLRQPYLLAPRLPFIPGVICGDGHSDYAAAFDAFAEAAAGALKASTALIVIGDGRTRGRGLGDRTLSDLRRRVKYLYWMTPEPETDWDAGDCRLEGYRPHCDRIDHVSTLAQLDRWVGHIILGA